MEQSDESKQNMETDVLDALKEQLSLPKLTAENLKAKMVAQYYKQPEMVRFLLADNLALKTVLLEHRLITAEEFAEHKKKALEVLDKQIQGFIDQRLNNNPAEAKLFKLLSGQPIEDFTDSELDQLGPRSPLD